MTAASSYWPSTGRFEVRGAFPAEPNLEARGEADGVGDRYLHMQERGELRVVPRQGHAGGPLLGMGGKSR